MVEIREFRFSLDDCRHTVQTINHLRVHGMLDPQRAVLIERCDAFLGWDEFRTCWVRSNTNEVDDRAFGVAIVPRWKRIALLRSVRTESKACGNRKHTGAEDLNIGFNGSHSN